MTRSFRSFFLKLITVLLFGIVLAAVLFFANGYSYDFVSQEFRKTGALNIKYEDGSAQVFLNGEKLDGKLPFVASNVLPGQYDLIVAKEGYWNWQRKVQVFEDLVNSVEDTFLYPQKVDDYAKDLMISNTDESTFVLSKNYLFKINGAGAALSYAKVDLREPLHFEEVKTPFGSIQNLRVDENFLVFQSFDQKIWTLNLSTMKWFGGNDSNKWNFAGGKWLYFKEDLVAVYDQGLSRVEYAFSLPVNNYKIANYLILGDLKIIALANDEFGINSDIFLISDNKLQLIAQGLNAKPILMGEKSLYYSNDKNELIAYDVNTGKSDVMKRFSEEFHLLNFLPETRTFLVKLGKQYYFSDLAFDNIFSVYEKYPILFVNIDTLKSFEILVLNNQKDSAEVILKRIKLI